MWQEDDPQDVTVMSVENTDNQGEDEIMYEKAPAERADDGKLFDWTWVACFRAYSY